jgi:3-dehydroquinate synthase
MKSQMHQFNSVRLLCKHLKTLIRKRKTYIITDTHVAQYWLSELLQHIGPHDQLEIIETDPGEASKSPEIAMHIIAQLIETDADKDSVIVNLGGGMISDLGGFVASVYKRGITHVNIPTTLLAMVDAASGGKTAVNHLDVKNVMGTFHEPAEVLLCADFLSTLPPEEIRSGMGEMLKHALLSNKTHWRRLLALEPEQIPSAELINESAQIKNKITHADFLENGKRKLLNLGHSFGHAYESYFIGSNNPFPHGHCIAEGMITETILAFQKKHIQPKHAEEIIQGIRKFFPAGKMPLPEFSELKSFLLHDKKNSGGKLKFSLPKSPWKAEYNIDVRMTEAEKAHKKALQMIQNNGVW